MNLPLRSLSLRPVLPLTILPRVAGFALFVALCALATWWVLQIGALRTIALPKGARVAQTEASETGALATLFGGAAQAGVRDVKLMGVVADLGGQGGAAIVSIDGGPPRAVRAGTSLSSQIRIAEIRGREIVIERNGVRQQIALPAQPAPNRGAAPAAALPLSGAAAPLATPMPMPAQPPQPVQGFGGPQALAPGQGGLAQPIPPAPMLVAPAQVTPDAAVSAKD